MHAPRPQGYLHDGVNSHSVRVLLRRLLDQVGGHEAEASEQLVRVGAGGHARRVCGDGGWASAVRGCGTVGWGQRGVCTGWVRSVVVPEAPH